jgi:hypothetical protein
MRTTTGIFETEAWYMTPSARSISQKDITTWRQLLVRHGSAFLAWLLASGREYAAIDRISKNLSDFLIRGIGSDSIECRDIALEFWNRIPDVLACCNVPTTFEKPFAAETLCVRPSA